MPNTTSYGQILSIKVVNIGPGSMWTLNLHYLKAIFVSTEFLHTINPESVRKPVYVQHTVTLSNVCVSQDFAYLVWNEISQKSQSSKRQNSFQRIILTQENRNGHTTLKNNIKHALQLPVWQESIIIQYRKNLTVKSYSMPLYR